MGLCLHLTVDLMKNIQFVLLENEVKATFFIVAKNAK